MTPFVLLTGNHLLRIDQIRRVEPTGATCNVHLMDGSKITIPDTAANTSNKILEAVASYWEATKPT